MLKDIAISLINRNHIIRTLSEYLVFPTKALMRNRPSIDILCSLADFKAFIDT